MQKRLRQGPNRSKPTALPQSHCALVCADYKVELHRPEASAARMFQRVLTHSACHTSPSRPLRRRIAAVRYMRSATALVRAHIVCPHDSCFVLGDKGFVLCRKPVRQHILPAHYSRQRIHLTCTNNRFHDRPNCISISCTRRTNLHHHTILSSSAGTHLCPQA